MTTNITEIFMPDLTNDPDLVTVTLVYHDTVTSGASISNVTLSEEEVRIQQTIQHYHSVATSIWRIWPPIALVFGTVGNILSGVVMTRKSLRGSTTSFLLTLLAVVDTLVLWTDLMRQWLRYGHDIDLRTFSSTACKMHKFFIFWNGTCAAWLNMMLSLERFVSIYLPITSKTWTTRTRVIIILTAVAAVIGGINLHHLWTYNLKPRSPSGYSCSTVGRYSVFLSDYWPWLNLTTYSIIPLSVMITTSTAIVAKLLWSQYQKNKTLNKDGGTGKMTSITLTLLCVCLMFVLTNGPITIDRVVQDNFVNTDFPPEVRARRRVTWALLVNINLLNASLNFVLYVLMAPSFRKQLIILFKNLKIQLLKACGRQIAPSSGNETVTSFS